MKYIVRAFVVALVLTGAIATTQTSAAAPSAKKAAVARTSMLPVPVCAPDDPNACGMAQGR